MYSILGSIALAYLAGSGTVTNNSVVGRGLFRAIRHLVEGEYREAGVETIAAVAAPAADGESAGPAGAAAAREGVANA